MPIHVRSAFSDSDGTWISEEKDLVLEKAIISGVTHDTSEAKATVLAVPDSPASRHVSSARSRTRESTST